MTIRKKILLYSALALGAFLAAVYLLSRFALLNGFARLESNYAHENVRRVRNELQGTETQLAIMARDYAQWDRTYNFVQSRDPKYVKTELTEGTFNIIHVDVFLLLDNSGKVALHKNVRNCPIRQTSLDTIASAYASNPAHGQNSPLKNSPAQNSPTQNLPINGLLDLDGRLFLVAYQPILTSRGDGTPRGTLVMGRMLNEAVISSVSRSVGLPLWLEPPDNAPSANRQTLLWTDGTSSVSAESDSTMLAYVPLKDLSGTTRRLLVARIPSELSSEASQVMRYLMLLLMLAGLVHTAVLLFLLEENLLARVAAVNSRIKQVTASGDLSLRLEAEGNDELSALARAVNAMLAAIQKAKFELLQAQESLRFHAEHDSLTGVLNRRAIRDVLRRELARCRRENQTLGVIVADVDHFKRINDHYGHGAGDAALVSVVQRISGVLRPYDAVGRYGGEEFLIIAPSCDFDLTQKLAERIRAAIERDVVDLGDGTITITASLGATLGTAESDPEFLVDVADGAMYQAKRNGRNRVETSLELPQHETEEPTLR